uniref:Prolyl 4-hydroxylase alpha subunit Fe(2+) 2OG dioxygenase domain-containing protein n=1 Tax=viral metagenome TaxID=1070528 RepID=A0A6C0H692_9ZZZZ
MIKNFEQDSVSYQQTQPFPYCYMDSALDEATALAVQQEILAIPPDQFDRYNNPFEQKYTLRDKHNLPPGLNDLFCFLESKSFVTKLSAFVGYSLFIDSTRNFHGVHLYENRDSLDIHVDAGIHPTLRHKKQVTLGLYLSYQWQASYGCELEIWQGDNAGVDKPCIYQCVDKIAPMFNRLVIFTNNDNSWHGNPIPAQCPSKARRIFITVSYLSHNNTFENKRQKAYFVKRPQDPEDVDKDRLRLLRCDPEKYTVVYRSLDVNNNKRHTP